jgi:hypothetical protein
MCMCIWLVVMFGVTGIFTAYNIAVHDHEHAEKTDMGYMKIRNKPYPWRCPDCNLFDYTCWNECEGKGKKDHEEHH